MDAKDVLRQVMESSDMIVQAYVGDLTDAELLVRSVPGANHTAWQLGHLVVGTSKMLSLLGCAAPAVPAEVEAATAKEAAASDDPAKFATKAQYMAMLAQAKAAVLAAIDATPQDALDHPGPVEMREYAPTVGLALLILGTHWLMHAGQFVPIRRKLGKPALF